MGLIKEGQKINRVCFSSCRFDKGESPPLVPGILKCTWESYLYDQMATVAVKSILRLELKQHLDSLLVTTSFWLETKIKLFLVSQFCLKYC